MLRANPDNFCFQWELPGLYYKPQLCMIPDQPSMNNIQRLKLLGEGNMSEEDFIQVTKLILYLFNEIYVEIAPE